MKRQTGGGLSRQSRRAIRALALVTAAAAIVALLGGAGVVVGGTRTVKAAGDPVIAAAGDIACDPAISSFNKGLGTSSSCRQKYTSDLLVNAGLSAVLDLGDNQYYCGGYHAYLESYDLSWGRVKSITHPSLGNHEYLTSGGTDCSAANQGAAGSFDYFGSAAGARGQGYYSFNVGSWHLIALNTSCSSVGGCGSGSPQYTWLKNDLATHNNYCTLAYWHIPLFSSGGRANGNSRPFWDLLYKYNADLVLTGHDHIYERFAPQNPSGVADSARGLREFVVGTGGADHTGIATVAANSQLRNATTFGVLKLTLHSTSYSWQFVPESGKTFTDSGTTNCHGTTQATATPTRTATPAAGTTPTATAAAATTKTFTPVADAYVSSSAPTTNYGTGLTLRADASPDIRSYVRFNVSGLSGTITRVRLRLYVNTGSSSYVTASKVSSNTWGETSVTYNTAPALGGSIGNSGTLTTATWVTVTVTSAVTGPGTYSFALTTPGASAISLGSRESGANAPQLIVDTGP